jgi:hypothetical protein
MVMRVDILIAPNSGAPGRIDLTDGKANRDVKQTANSWGAYSKMSVVLVIHNIHTINTWNRCIITPSQVMIKINTVESQLTTTATTVANLTRRVLSAVNDRC